MPAPRPTVVFDLDGTLAETAPDIIGTLNAILAEDGLPPFANAQARDLVGAGVKVLLERAYGIHEMTLAPGRLDALFETFLDLYAGRIADETLLYPGAEAALDAVAELGFLAAVCTNKPERHSRLLLDALGVSGRFAAICGRETFPFCKPDPRHLVETIRMAGGDPARAVMVGDSRTDVATAKAAGIPAIVVPFGYTDVPAKDLGADLLIEHFDELAPALRAWFGLKNGMKMVGATGIEPVTPPV